MWRHVILHSLLSVVLVALIRESIALSPPLRTQSRWIIDQNGDRVTLNCVNWYGSHLRTFVVSGLNMQPVDTISGRIAGWGFNCVRLTFSTELVVTNPVITNLTYVSSNPELVNSTALQVLDRVVESLTGAGLMVILNNHIGRAGWCCNSTDGEGLWYSDTYPASVFFSNWQMMARRYGNNSYVIGADLYNELRNDKRPGMSYRNPTWTNISTGNNATNWAAAATQAGNKVLAINPKWLIFVEGLSYATDLTAVRSCPIVLNIPNRLVYSAHNYAWSYNGSVQASGYGKADTPTYQQFQSTVTANWGHILNATTTATSPNSSSIVAPLWLGEFGTGNTSQTWWQYIRRYIKEQEIGWAYWAVDGLKNYPSFGVGEPYGIFKPDYRQVRQFTLGHLQELMANRSRGPHDGVADSSQGPPRDPDCSQWPPSGRGPPSIRAVTSNSMPNDDCFQQQSRPPPQPRPTNALPPSGREVTATPTTHDHIRQRQSRPFFFPAV